MYAAAQRKPSFAVVMAQEKVASIRAADAADRRLEQSYPEKYEELSEAVLSEICEFFVDHKDVSEGERAEALCAPSAMSTWSCSGVKALCGARERRERWSREQRGDESRARSGP